MSFLHSLLDQQFCDGGDRAVVVGTKGTVTSYAEFAAQIAGIQQAFAARGTKGVGVLSTRRQEAYAAVVAAFGAGVRFVPMNPDLPPERLAKIMDLGAVDLVLCDRSTAKLAEVLGAPHLDVGGLTSYQPPAFTCVDPAALAYQMFTSGSTGDPKGVPISYACLSHYVTTIIPALNVPSQTRFSQLFDLSFDLSLHDIFVALASGGTLCPASKMDLMMPHSYLAKKEIDVWFSVPMLAALAARGQAGTPPPHRMQMALFCGEALPTQYAADFEQFLEDGAPLYNLYGPTEATIAITVHRFDAAATPFSSVPLGDPFGGSRIAVEAEDGTIAPVGPGAEGELLLGGPQVFDGYRPETGLDCFVTAPSGARFYRSGDLVRVEDNELLHMGRSDNQIKLRGYRIELGDIEAAARGAFGVTAVAAVVLGEGVGREIGLAYEAATNQDGPAALKGVLADYMMPTRWLRVETMPVNITGKMDRNALRQMTWPD